MSYDPDAFTPIATIRRLPTRYERAERIRGPVVLRVLRGVLWAALGLAAVAWATVRP